MITVPSLYFKTTKTMKSEWWKLKENEKEAYLKIICGEEPPEYFDIFVRSWQENGGAQITDEVKAAHCGQNEEDFGKTRSIKEDIWLRQFQGRPGKNY